MPSILSIGTTHPWNIAGTGVDVRVGAEFGVHVMTAVAAVSAQDARGVHALHAVPPETFEAQLTSVPWETIGAVRVGALPDARTVLAVAAALAARPRVPAVVDPVLSATRGGMLAAADVLPALRERLATLPHVILTPNLDEAASLLGRAAIARDELEAVAMTLRSGGARAVLLKGGHLSGEPTDVFADAGGVECFGGERLAVAMRGTGCVLAASLACALARGDALREAVGVARAFVREKIRSAHERAGLRVAY